MQLPQPSNLTIPQLIEHIACGSYRIPQFQRKFVWSVEQSADLIDSILKGYPIGTLILWQTKERFLSDRTIADISLPAPRIGEPVTYILDGQQRVTSLFTVLRGHTIFRKGVFLNLIEKGACAHPLGDAQASPREFVEVRSIYHDEGKGLTGLSLHNKQFLRECRKRLHDYKIPVVLMTEAHIEEATDIFARINMRGKRLSTFDVMVAKTYIADPPFDLAERCENLNVGEKGLEKYGFGKFSNDTILQAASAIIHKGKEPSSKNIFHIGKFQLRDDWKRIEEALRRTARHFHETLGVPYVDLLPYTALTVPFAYFYAQRSSPSVRQVRLLNDFFWRASLGGRYQSHVTTMVGQDLKRMNQILNGKQPDYQDYKTCFEPSEIEQKGEFRLNDSYIKGLICLLALQKPRGFGFIKEAAGVIVITDKHSLLKNESKNYHHFFPTAYLRRRSTFEPPANHIANITLLSAQENQSIGARAPKIYLKTARPNNRNLNSTLRTHLIDAKQLEKWVEDYDAFFKMRCLEISKAIKNQLVDS